MPKDYNINKIKNKGTTGDLFYIIRSGEVRITKDKDTGGEEEVARYGKGRYFGEIALIKEDVRMANVYALGIVKERAKNFNEFHLVSFPRKITVKAL